MEKHENLGPPAVPSDEKDATESVPLEPGLPVDAMESSMDRGKDAWLAVLGCWVLIFNSWFAETIPSCVHLLISTTH